MQKKKVTVKELHAKGKKTTKQKYNWSNYFKETFQENKKFFIAILLFMGISIVLGVAQTFLIKPTISTNCKQKISQAIENKVASANLNCKYK